MRDIYWWYKNVGLQKYSVPLLYFVLFFEGMEKFQVAAAIRYINPKLNH